MPPSIPMIGYRCWYEMVQTGHAMQNGGCDDKGRIEFCINGGLWAAFDIQQITKLVNGLEEETNNQLKKILDI